MQLERIRASIQDLVNQEDLESLQHLNFPPWNKDTPYSIDISPLPKDEAALVYNTNLYLGTNKFTIYTDASSIPGEDSKGVGVGLVVLNYNKGTPRVVHRSMANLGDS